MLAVAHDARLARLVRPDDPKSPTVRQVLEAKLANGHASAQSELDGPEVPEEFEYLRNWSAMLHGRSGLGMSGVAPLAPSEVIAWSQGTGHQPTPAEFEALLFLDSVRRDPTIVDRKELEAAIEEPAPKVPAAQRWPKKKAAT